MYNRSSYLDLDIKCKKTIAMVVIKELFLGMSIVHSILRKKCSLTSLILFFYQTVY